MSDELLRLLNPDTFGDEDAEARLCVLLMRRTGVDGYDRERDIEPFINDGHPPITDEHIKQWNRWASDTRASCASALIVSHDCRSGIDDDEFHAIVERNYERWSRIRGRLSRLYIEEKRLAFLASLRWVRRVPSVWHIVNPDTHNGGHVYTVCGIYLPMVYDYALGSVPSTACSACRFSTLWRDGIDGNYRNGVEYSDGGVHTHTFEAVGDE